MRYPERVTLTEAGPRDGLQNESREIPLAQKIALVDTLSVTGRALRGAFQASGSRRGAGAMSRRWTR